MLYVPPAGLERGAIRYEERLHPLEPLHRLLSRAMERMPRFRAEPPRVEHLVTAEGEYAALATVRGTLDDAPAQRDLGFVFGDDFYTRLSSLAIGHEDFDARTSLVRQLVRDDVQLLGVRRRRYLFEPPRGWRVRARGLQAELYAERFPNDPAMISVWPALPRAAAPQVEELADELLGSQRSRPEAVASRHGLEGSTWDARWVARSGREQHRRLAILDDDRYLYVARLEAGLDGGASHDETFLAMIGSIRPAPRPSSQPAPRELVAYWADL